MFRPLWFVNAIVLLAVTAPVHGQGLLEAIGDAIDSAIEESEMPDQGASSTFIPDHHPNHHPGHWYHPGTNYPTSQYQRIWNGSHWEYVLISPSVVYPSNSVVYPSPTVVSPATTISSAAVTVTPNALPYKGPGVTIKLEEEVGGAVNYTLDGKESATIQAGQQQTLTAKGRYEIRFSRGRAEDGRDFGQARYTITEGNYHFAVTDKGWELLRDKEQPNLVTNPIQPSSPSGIKTNALPPKPAPSVTPAASPKSSSPQAVDSPTPNALPSAKATTTSTPIQATTSATDD